MKQLLLVCLSVLVLFGCGKDDETAEPLINAYAARYMIDKHSGIMMSTSQAFILEYINGKPIKRTAGAKCLLDNSCQDEPSIIYDVTYAGDQIEITTRSGSTQYDVIKVNWWFKLKDANRIEYEVYKQPYRSGYDSLSYAYKSTGQLNQIIGYSIYKTRTGTYVNKDYIKKFFFDSSGNLEKVETHNLWPDETTYTILTETFWDYDMAVNPFKKLFLFDDTFYRSLSRNNFRKYNREIAEVRTGQVSHLQRFGWELQYSAANVPLFDKL